MHSLANFSLQCGVVFRVTDRGAKFTKPVGGHRQAGFGRTAIVAVEVHQHHASAVFEVIDRRSAQLVDEVRASEVLRANATGVGSYLSFNVCKATQNNNTEWPASFPARP